MYCLKCKFTSFDHLDKCPKCGRDWKEQKKDLNLDWLLEYDPDWMNLESPKGEMAEQFVFDDDIKEQKDFEFIQPTLEKGSAEDLGEEDFSEIEFDFQETEKESGLGPNDPSSGFEESKSRKQGRTEEKSDDNEIFFPDLDQALQPEEEQKKEEKLNKPEEDYSEEDLEMLMELEIEPDSAEADTFRPKGSSTNSSAENSEGKKNKDELSDLDDLEISLELFEDSEEKDKS